MALVAVSADKLHLVNPTGQPFFVLGVNYAGYFDRAWKMWAPDRYDPELIARDFRKAQNSGFNTVRLFVHAELFEELENDNFARLDETLSLAQDHQLLVILTLNDAHYLDLRRVSQVDARLAARYDGVPTLMAYDLENEPVFYNLAAAIYPTGYRPPIQTSQLVDQYGARVQRDQVADWRRRHWVPAHLSEEEAFYYINALQLFLEFDASVKAFVNRGQGNLVDFLLSGEATPWHPLIGVLDQTVESWLRVRTDPMRAAGARHLITVGWSWLHFAALPANRLLDFQSYHHYTSLSRDGFNTNVAHLESLCRAFPSHPILLGEFGWSNQSSTNPASSRLVDPQLTALYEAATYAYLRANGLAGGLKWMLNDVQGVDNPYEASFGVFSVSDKAKPIRDLAARFSECCQSLESPGTFTQFRDLDSGLAYRFDLQQQLIVGGAVYQDQAISWRAESVGHCFIRINNEELLIEAVGAGQLALDPWDLIPTWNRARETDLYRVYSDSQRTRQQTFGAGQSVVVQVRPGALYLVTMGAETPVYPPPEGAPRVDPRPGEHVLLLADADQYLPAALKYIRRFGPDFSFAADQVAGRWAYVSIVAPAEDVPEELLDNIWGAGAILVERVAGDTVEKTRAMLDELARRGQRFLTAVAPAPPQEEPPDEPGQPKPPPVQPGSTYVVQPGDTLSKIAQQVYGDFRRWPLIFEANRDKLTDPSLIRVGMELQIPQLETV
jgi:LysM repeat protein